MVDSVVTVSVTDLVVPESDVWYVVVEPTYELLEDGDSGGELLSEYSEEV